MWLSTDPLQEKYPNISSYAYTFQNPVKYIDPRGMEGENPNGVYTVQDGDTFDKLENSWNMPAGMLSGLNPDVNSNKLSAGQQIITDPDIPVNSATKIVNEDSKWKYTAGAGVISLALLADDATVIGVVDDVAIPVLLIGGLIMDALTTPKPITIPDYDPGQFYYATYTKTNPTTGLVYVGRTSGFGDPANIVKQRDSNHHMTEQGYSGAVLSTFAKSTSTLGFVTRVSDPAYWSIRGSEQLQIESYRSLGISGNAINGISPSNGNLGKYLNEARKMFGY